MYSNESFLNENANGKKNVVMHLKSSFNPVDKSGFVFLALDFEDCSSKELQCFYPKVQSNNYLDYLALATGIRTMKEYNYIGSIYSSSQVVVFQISGDYTVNKQEFLPFNRYIKDNMEGISIEFKPSCDIKMSSNVAKVLHRKPYDDYEYIKQVKAEILVDVERLMTDSLCQSVQNKFPLSPHKSFKREQNIRHKCELISGRKYAKRKDFEGTDEL